MNVLCFESIKSLLQRLPLPLFVKVFKPWSRNDWCAVKLFMEADAWIPYNHIKILLFFWLLLTIEKCKHHSWFFGCKDRWWARSVLSAGFPNSFSLKMGKVSIGPKKEKLIAVKNMNNDVKSTYLCFLFSGYQGYTFCVYVL